MRKRYFALPLLLMLTACGGTPAEGSQSLAPSQGESVNVPASEAEKDYAICTFHYNDGREGDDTYKRVVVMKDKDILRPEEPILEDRIFTGWYRDPNTTKQFQGFNDILVQDLDLYAGWANYDSATDIVKLQKMESLMEKLSGTVTHASVKENSSTYYAMANQILPSGANIEYDRYSDMTVANYYDPDKEVKDDTSLYATQQFQYDKYYFYNLYHDIEGNGANDKKQTATFNSKRIEDFLSIDFANLYMGPVRNLIDCLSDGESGLEDYEFDCNYTKVNTDTGSYSFKLSYVTVQLSEQLGNVENDYSYEFGITFLDGIVTSCKRVAVTAMGIEGDLLFLDETTDTVHFTQGNEFPHFQGTYLEPTDFN